MNFLKVIALSLVMALFACGEPEVKPALPATGNITVEQWKALPPAEKYDEATFDRLRESMPELKSDAAWDKFMKEVIIPERKIDIPGTPGVKEL